MVRKGLFFICWLVSTYGADAQNVTIINNYDGDNPNLSEESFVLKNVTEHTYIINEYEPTNTGPRSHLEQMISYGIRSLVDNQYHPFDGKVEAIYNPTDFNTKASEIVKNAIWIHDQPFSELFPGFSENVTSKVKAIRSIDGYDIQMGENDIMEAQNNRIGLYSFQRMVYDLKKACEEEYTAFLDEYMPQSNRRGYDESESQILSFKEYRVNRDYENEDDLSDIKPNPADILPEESKKDRRKRRKDRNSSESPFTERIVQLLEENNKILANYNTRFQDLQNQIDDIREDGGNNSEIRDEIAELRKMIVDLANGKEVTEENGSKTKLVTEERLSITFARNEHKLSTTHMARLNKVPDVLRSNPGYTAVITGYADKSGDPAFNAWISRKRAVAVRDYLERKGISKTRLVVNFLGDEESLAPNPEDRKVEIQYIVNFIADQ